MFKTTAIYDNRLLDKIELENKLGLSEQGNQNVCFYSSNGVLLFCGYERIVYGDHGPYIEFSLQNFRCKVQSKFGNYIDYHNLPINSKYYYYWLYPICDPSIKIYLQIKPVSDKPNAPRREDNKPSCFNRSEGYADYKRGFFYINPYSLTIDIKG